jgi:2,3-bisphosphoglycerate-independent phosphoglycerate mutase
MQGVLTAGLIDYVSAMFRERLKDHPVNQQRAAAGKNIANVILLRGCGMRLRLPSFQERHGLRSCIVAPTKILGGVIVPPCLGFHKNMHVGRFERV